MQIVTRDEMAHVLDPLAVIAAIKGAFVAHSRGEIATASVAHLAFADPPGDMHIKAGYRRGGDFAVVKIASGFYRNPESGLSSSQGMMLILSALTGEPVAMLADDGWLTDVRTAAAGAVAAEYLAPRDVECIGIVGSGIQAHMQLDLLRHVTRCRKAKIWARNAAKAEAFEVDGFDVSVAASCIEIAESCNLIITSTPAREKLIPASTIREGTHITAVGADAAGKQELDPRILQNANIRAVDSREQCIAFGESAHAVSQGLVDGSTLVEIGEIIARGCGRSQADEITIADLTGIAAQDVAIASMVWDLCGQ